MIFKKGLAPMTIEKIKILEAALELPTKQHCYLFFLIAMGADY